MRIARRGVLVAVAGLALVLAVGWACDPPGGGISSPGDGETVSGTARIEISVTSETEVKGVDIYLDGNLLESLSEAPYAYDWDTTKVANGEHTLSAKVRALDRPEGEIAGIKVTVANKAAT